MRRDELGVEQHEAAGIESVHQMGHGHLAGIGAPVEHGFPEKSAANGQAIKPADQLGVVPDLHGMGDATPEQLAIDATNGAVDPGGGPIGADRGAALDDGVEIGIHLYRKARFADRLAQAGGAMEAVERNDAAPFRADPEDVLVLGAFGHGEDARPIGAHDQFGSDFELEGIGSAGHEGVRNFPMGI